MSTLDNVLNYAISQLGTKENPSGSNKVKYNTWYYGKEVSGSAYPWCAVFICYVFNKCGVSSLFCGGKKVAYCPSIENFYKSKNCYYSNKKGQRGDLCIMDFGKGRASHIGIVEKKNPDETYTVIEGNTSVSSNDNGGCVMRRIRKTKVIRGFCRPDYKSIDSVISPTISTVSNSISQFTPLKGNPSHFAEIIKNIKIALNIDYGLKFTIDSSVNNILLVNLTNVILSTTSYKKNITYALQQLLKWWGYDITLDGIFGNGTKSIVSLFQSQIGIAKTGTTTKEFWYKILGKLLN